MAVEYVASLLKCQPTAAAGVAVTPNTSSGGAAGAYAEIIASTPTAWVLSGIEAQCVPGGTFDNFFAIVDIATGAAASETVIASFPMFQKATTASAGLNHTLPILLQIASGVRVSARIRRWDDTGFTGAWKVKVLYFESPITGVVTTTTQVLKIYPTAGGRAVVASAAGVFVNGAWVVLEASTAAAVVLVGMMFGNASNGADMEFDIAVGAAGAEVVVATVKYWQSGVTGSPSWVPFTSPLDRFPSGSRITVRSRADNGASSPQVALNYLEKPL